MNNVCKHFFLFFILSIIFDTIYSYVSLFPENVTSLQLTRSLSNQCLNQLKSLSADPMFFSKMIDSSTKIPNGILNGNIWDLGNFDECYNLESTINNDVLYGKYCLGTVPFPSSTNVKDLSTILRIRPVHPVLRQMSIGLHWAICVPHQCSSEEISIIPTFKEEYCYSKANAPKLTTGAIITIVVLSIFLLISVCSTIYDIFLYYMDKKVPHELLVAFSMLTNGRKLFKSSTNPDQLSCLNGLRAISMMWVILGHTFSSTMLAPLINTMEALKYIKDQSNMFIVDASLSVDTFFTVGGVVIVYAFLKSMDKGAKFNLILYYIHRYLRLTPVFGICILIYANLLKYLDNGPLWKEIEETLSNDCIKYWWSSFFYISNYALKICIPQSWYLSVDVQLFLLSPLVLISLYRFEKIGVYFLYILCLLGVIVPFTIGYAYKLNAFMFSDMSKHMIYYYMQTHTRFGPYVLGMLLGYLLFKTKKGELNITLKPKFACGLWLVTIAGLIACVYAPYDTFQTYDRVTHSLLLGLQRPAWSLGVCIVIYLCVSGYGGPINKFLSLSIFQLLAKLSYSMYLIHYAIVSVDYYRTKTLLHFSNYDMMFEFWGNFMLSLILSIFLCLCFESPVIVLEKYLFGAIKKNKKTVP